jgi:hypothetical protein
MEMLLRFVSCRFEIFLVHARMLRHTYIVFLVLKWLGVKFISFCVYQHKMFPERLVLLSQDYMTPEDFSNGMAREGEMVHLIFSTSFSNRCYQPSYFPQ